MQTRMIVNDISSIQYNCARENGIKIDKLHMWDIETNKIINHLKTNYKKAVKKR